jgi:ABC-type multidrug transport system fused ATPase/permease subunit
MRAAIFNILSERIARNLRKDFYESLMYKDVAFYDANRTGDLISRLNSDIQVVQSTLGNNVSMLARGILFILVVLVILSVISPILTGVTFAGIIPLILFSYFYQKWMRVLGRALQAVKAQMNTVAEESFANIRTVKAFSNEDEEMNKFANGNQVTF